VPGHHHCIRSARQPLVLERERLAEQALDPVPVDGATDLARHRQPKPRRRILSTREHVEHELATGVRAPAPEHAVEVGAA
jgi:hypothetical protein